MRANEENADGQVAAIKERDIGEEAGWYEPPGSVKRVIRAELHKSPYHMLMLRCKEAGASNRSIAKVFGYSRMTINRDMKWVGWLLRPEHKAEWDAIKAAWAASDRVKAASDEYWNGTRVPPADDAPREESELAGTFVPKREARNA